jgi:hypothetical protein
MWTRTLIAIAGLTCATSTARAEETIPPQCRQFASLPADRRDTTLAWNQMLSLAACVRDASTPHVTSVGELAPMVATMFERLAPALLLDLAALQHGPEPVQVRAAYQIGMLYVEAIVRARGAIDSNTLGARALHLELEELLANARRTARIVFVAIDDAVTENPALDSDPVAHYVIESSRTMMKLLATPAESSPPTFTWVRAD